MRPLTNHTPKPMLPVAGRPLLEHTLAYLREFNVTEIGINLYHLPEKVMDHFGDGSKWGVNLRYSVEEQLVGSAGGVKRLQDFFDGTFIVYYGDIFTQANLQPMIDLHRRTGTIATMGLYEVPDPWNRGIVQLDDAQTIVRFAEKPPRDKVFSNLANAGIYIMEPEIFNWIPPAQEYDFGDDVFPYMLAKRVKIAGYVIKEPLIDIGLPEKYEEANQLASEILSPVNN